jgi:hypothetical protein
VQTENSSSPRVVVILKLQIKQDLQSPKGKIFLPFAERKKNLGIYYMMCKGFRVRDLLEGIYKNG